jgi:hypothetical protein
MTRVPVLGAKCQLARNTTRVFLEQTDVALGLFSAAGKPAQESLTPFG